MKKLMRPPEAEEEKSLMEKRNFKASESSKWGGN